MSPPGVPVAGVTVEGREIRETRFLVRDPLTQRFRPLIKSNPCWKCHNISYPEAMASTDLRTIIPVHREHLNPALVETGRLRLLGISGLILLHLCPVKIVMRVTTILGTQQVSLPLAVTVRIKNCLNYKKVE